MDEGLSISILLPGKNNALGKGLRNKIGSG